MKRFSPVPIMSTVGAAFLLISGSEVRAQLFASVNLDQVIFAIDNGPPFMQAGHTFTTTTVPYQETATANDGGGFITGAYSITDNGNVATFSVNLSATITALNQNIGEDDGGVGSTFSLSRPANYRIVITDTGDTEDGIFMEGGGVYIPQEIEDTTEIFTGVATTPGSISYQDDFGFIGGGYNMSSATGSVTESFTFTAITPIPEPSSALLIGVPALTLLARRPRPVRTSQLLGQDNEQCPRFNL